MPAEDVLAEQLCRIEWKLDLLLRNAKLPSIMLMPMDSPGQSCPACKQSVEYKINVTKKVVTRKCGCGTGKIPNDMDLFTSPIPGAIGGTSGNAEPEEPQAQDRRRRR